MKRYIRHKAEGLRRMRRWLEEVGENCPICYVQWHLLGCEEKDGQQWLHERKRCRMIPDAEYRQWRGQVRFGDYSCCWGCGLPQRLCGGWETNECEDGDKMLPVVMMAGRSRRLQLWVWKEFGLDPAEGKRYVEWIGRSRRLYGEEMTNGIAVWDLIIRQIYENKN